MISVTATPRNTGQVFYNYTPEAGYVGSDFVEIRTGRGSDGAGPDTVITMVQINFNITQ